MAAVDKILIQNISWVIAFFNFVMVIAVSFVLCIVPQNVFAQVPVTPPIIEQQLEAITENNEDVETEDDSFLQTMRQYFKNPINLNTPVAKYY